MFGVSHAFPAEEVDGLAAGDIRVSVHPYRLGAVPFGSFGVSQLLRLHILSFNIFSFCQLLMISPITKHTPIKTSNPIMHNP